MRGRKKRTLILGILCCLLVFMGVGFAVARTTLNIGGTSTAINTWDVRITNILFKSSSDGVTTNGDLNKVLDDGTTAEINVDFIKPGDYITFEFSVENNGSIDASIGTLDIALSSDNETDNELFDISNTFPENSKLEAGNSVDFEVTIKYKDEADKIPEGTVTFDVKLNYSQGDGNGGGNTPGGGTEPEKNWDFEVDDSGTIVAYNYDLGTDVVIPATNYEGKAIKTITEQSFLPKGNLELYYSEEPEGMYLLISEDEPNFTNIKDKLMTMFLMECQGDSDCENQYKSMIYVCKDKNTCYNVSNLEQNKSDSMIELVVNQLSNSAVLDVTVYVNPDPSVPLEESIVELTPNVTTLDLSKAINLTAIGDYAFYNYDLTDVEFGKNSSVTTVGDGAFSYNQISGELVIPNSVTTIGTHAFQGNQISSLIIPDSVTTIGIHAFLNNQISGELLIPDSVEVLNGFAGNQISSLIVPDSVTTIGNYAFSSNQISSLTIPASVTTIGNEAFYENQISGELAIPDSVTSIGDQAFRHNQISELTIPNSVTTIGNEAFYENQISGELAIPDSVTSIGDRAFSSNQINSLTLGNSVTTIGTYAFRHNQISRLKLGDSVTSIGDSAFYSNQISGELIIPDSVTTIGNNAFYKNQISSLTLGDSVTSIGDYAFYSNQISGELVISNSVAKIGSNAFKDNEISNLIMTHELEIGELVFNNNKLPNERAFIYENNKSGGKLMSYGGTGGENIIIPSNTTSIVNYAFHMRQISGNLVIPDGVIEIGEDAFSYNDISSLTIPKSVTKIGSSAFEDNEISSLMMTHELEMGERAFNDNKLPNEQAFIYENNKKSGKLVSYGGAERDNIIIPSDTTAIGDYAFFSLSISSVEIPNSVVFIGNSAFGFNLQLESITIKRTEEDFLANVTVDSYWYDDRYDITIIYDPS